MARAVAGKSVVSAVISGPGDGGVRVVGGAPGHHLQQQRDEVVALGGGVVGLLAAARLTCVALQQAG